MAAASNYDWASPGGVYRVPDSWRERLQSEFPDFRVRWSLRRQMWQIEQSYGNPLPPVRIGDDAHDDLIRARDGYWLFMETAPGDRIPCPVVVTSTPRQLCGWTLKAPFRDGSEVKCPACRRAGRDGRTVCAYWPFDELLLDRLRQSNPATWGIVKSGSKTVTWASEAADKANALLERERERQTRDAVTSIDAVDHRWMTGIASSTGRQRKYIDEKDLL